MSLRGFILDFVGMRIWMMDLTYMNKDINDESEYYTIYQCIEVKRNSLMIYIIVVVKED